MLSDDDDAESRIFASSLLADGGRRRRVLVTEDDGSDSDSDYAASDDDGGAAAAAGGGGVKKGAKAGSGAGGSGARGVPNSKSRAVLKKWLTVRWEWSCYAAAARAALFHLSRSHVLLLLTCCICNQSTRHNSPSPNLPSPLHNTPPRQDHFLPSESHPHGPFPTKEEKQELARQTGLTVTQVGDWFINARARQWRPAIERVCVGLGALHRYWRPWCVVVVFGVFCCVPAVGSTEN